MTTNAPLGNISQAMKHVHELATWMKRYEKFTPETRFLMLADKLQMLLMGLKVALAKNYEDHIKHVDHEDLSPQAKTDKKEHLIHEEEAINLALQIIAKEFDALEDFIQSDSKSHLKNIEDKLDAVLEGPDYKPGQEIMNNAQNDFYNKIN